jgi:hypothetical protein
MPAVSKAQQRLMGAAEHGATFPMAQKVRATMTMSQLHDFASGPETGKPTHVPKPPKPRSAGPLTRKVPQRVQTQTTQPHPHRNLGKYIVPKGGY